VRSGSLRPHDAGLTLIELMVSLALGLLVIMVTSALLLSTKSSYVAQDDEAQLHDSARYALDLISRAARQAGYENWDTSASPYVAAASMSANVVGLNARRLKATSVALEEPVTPSFNGSDVLGVRFFGSGAAPDGDGTMLNCAGFSVPAPSSPTLAGESRGWSIFYVAQAASGDLELYCKYRGKTAWTAQSIARGVEAFQVLYGVDLNDDGLPDRYMHAQAVEGLDDALVLEGSDLAERLADRHRKTHWKKIVVLRVALLVRGHHGSRTDRAVAEFDAFGKDYADAYAASDPGVRIRESELPAAARNRPRRLFTATIQLRNQSGGSAT
jgi:type IV pilus assembly protein PilW